MRNITLNFDIDIPQHGISIKEANNIKTMLKGLVIAPLDRNNGEVSIQCPLRYHKNMTKHAENATRIDKTFSAIQNEMRNSYNKLKIAKIINFQTDHKVPRVSGHPYLMDKDKDINRQRPVIPGFNNGSAKAQRIISSALNLYIKNTQAVTRDMHIWDPTKLRHHLQKEVG